MVQSLEKETRRLFFALWPDAALQQRSYAAMHRGALHIKGGRRTRWENLHLTLAFLGSIDATHAVALQAQADAIRVASFDLTFDQLGGHKQRGLLWLAPSRVPSALLQLVEALRAAQQRCGLEPEQREYRAHVTLARDLRRCPPPTAITPPIEWPVESFTLLQSETGPGGSRYTLLRSWALSR